ncbi:MAG: AAA family ATPase [Candidatus Omnitrophica bacterium]|nr:AAA family ATPase [Candidatus Omnitrophota bacterium]
MYLDFYGLKENPFNVTSDPSFLFLSRTHKEALDHLLFGINERKGFIAITGEIGAGKTTLCRALLSHLAPGTKTAVIFNSNLPEMQLLEAIVGDFGITPEKHNKISLMKSFNKFLLEQLARNNNVVLIIDEAQNLKTSTLETIRMLSNLETYKEKLLQIVLVGQPELAQKLKSPELVQLRQRIAVNFHLQALSKDEVVDYINHRLQVAGAVKNILFGAFAADLVADFSGGIPRLINILCDKALLLGFVKNTQIIGKAIIEQSIEELKGNYTFAGR